VDSAFVSLKTRGFLGPRVDQLEARRAAVHRATRPLAGDVFEALVKQNARWGLSPARERNLEKLRRGAAAAVSGQQTGLFLGPLYTLYKAASAIRVAQQLSVESGSEVVPVFWLQTEDHDLAEIAHCSISYGQGEILDLDLAVDRENRRSIAHLCLPSEIDALHQRLTETLGHLPDAASHLDRLRRHYQSGARWADAFAGMLAELLADSGLVLLDPRDAALSAAHRWLHRSCLQSADNLEGRLVERSEELHEAGLEPAIALRAQSPLSFFHVARSDGPRHRLQKRADGTYAQLGGGEGCHTLDQLLAILEADPLRFSTSALARPLLQDHLLPTAAYIGGPGELAYFTQVTALYPAFDLPTPLLVPRARCRIVDERAARLLSRLSMRPEQLEQPEAAVLEQVQAQRGEINDRPALESALWSAFDRALTGCTAQLLSAGQGLDVAIAKLRQRVRDDLDKLFVKYESARQHRDAALVAEVSRLRGMLFPRDTPQERVFALSGFAARIGERALIEQLLRRIDPFDTAVLELR
jgi:bacillithiol biosynthesis cysteine-adding enzyme BshC